MFDAIIAYSVRNKLVIGMLTGALIVWGLWSLRQLPIDAIPDITNNQVQVITTAPALATQEVEQFITTPLELALQNLQDLVEIRSISRFGLSVITVVFEEDVDVYLARQLVGEALGDVAGELPPDVGAPEMAPISTGLGEIYQYVVHPEPGYEDQYSATDLRTIQDWIVSRQLAGIPGVVEVNSLGGYVKRYEVAVEPNRLRAMGVSLLDVYGALEQSNENTGGAYIERDPRTYYIRSDGLVTSLEDVGDIVVDVRNGRPIRVRDVGTVQFGTAPRYGALVWNGREAVGGKVMMLRGANSAEVTELVRARVEEIKPSLPEGVTVEPYLVRDRLVDSAISTVQTNLLEGGLIVVFILVLLLGNWRAGLVVASVIPLAMLFAVSMMNVLGISANLMSLGAIDFGLIVDGAVIIVEAIVHRLQVGFAGQRLSPKQMDVEVTAASVQIRSSAAFGEIIILMVYLPILALVGIEGKMFRPMAQTVMLAILGALILSLTYVPAMSALLLNKTITDKRTIADRIIGFFQRLYTPVLAAALRLRWAVVAATVALFAVSVWAFARMGGEFIPTLEEGDLAMQQILPPGTSLTQTVETTKRIHGLMREAVPEIREIVANIGAAEIPTDPMSVEVADYTIVMAPKDEWVTATTREGMFAVIEEALEVIPGVALEFSQPIQLRFNELMTGSKADIAIKLYGADLDVAAAKANEARDIIASVPGVGSVNVEQAVGMPQIVVDYRYDRMAQYGVQVREINRVISGAFAGAVASTVYEGERRYDLVVRLAEDARADISAVRDLYVTLDSGAEVPLREVATVELQDAPMQISRDNTNRRIVIGVNVGETDTETLVNDIRAALDARLDLPPGYYLRYGGQFENLQAAQARLSVAVPLALALIFILLYFTFGSLSQAALIFVAIPLSAIGGIWALELRGMPFSISAGIGFIALFGVAVLNGIVLVGYLNQLRREGVTDVRERIFRGTSVRLRPVLMTASVASLGFLPMALSTSGGAEVQRPLATVVIGGLLTATLLTLVVLPVLYSWLATWQERRARRRGDGGGTTGFANPKDRVSKAKSGGSTSNTKLGGAGLTALLLLAFAKTGYAQDPSPPPVSVDEIVDLALTANPTVRAADLQVGAARGLLDLPYQPGLTQIAYEGEGLFQPNGNRLAQFGITQSLGNPATTRAANARQEVEVLRLQLERGLTAQSLTYAVRSVAYRLQHERRMLDYYRALAVRYAEFERIASTRVELGAANAMERLVLVPPLERYRLGAAQAERSIEGLRAQLGLLTGRDDIGDVIGDTLAQAPVAITLSDSANLLVRVAEQAVRSSEAEAEVLSAGLKPSAFVGYGVQKFFETPLLNAFQAGVTVPLFRGQTNRRIAAARLSTDAAAAQVEATRRQVEQTLVSLRTEVATARLAVDAYRAQLITVAPELRRVTALNYEAGEITALEVAQTLSAAAEVELAYLRAVLDYNLSVAALRRALNQ